MLLPLGPPLDQPTGTSRSPSAARAATSIGLDSGPSALDALTAAFADRPFLLVVDNFEQVWANAPDIAELPARYPKPSVLATSRLPLLVRPAVGACGVAGSLSAIHQTINPGLAMPACGSACDTYRWFE